DAWSDGPEAYLGITVADFPNFFMLYGPNTNLGHNAITFMLEKQVDYMIAALAVMTDEKLAAIAPTRAAQDAFNAELQANLAETVWSDPSCNSWYKTAAGRITQNWGSHTRAYAQAVSDVRIADYETQR
ncbi:MAG: 4-hydroxyacetophenone monooxygenase, partial [Henriciella sp.]